MAQLVKFFFILSALGPFVHAGPLRHAAQKGYYSDLKVIILELKPEKRHAKLNKKKNDKTILEIIANNPDSEEKRLFLAWLKEQLEPRAPLIESATESYSGTHTDEEKKINGIGEALELIAEKIYVGYYKDLLIPDSKQINTIVNFAALKLAFENKTSGRFDLCNTKECLLEVVSFKQTNGYAGFFVVDENTKLGEGAQGCIKLAQNLQCFRSDKCLVAVKKCNIADATRRRDSENECKILGHLNRSLGGVFIGNNSFLFMELYRAITLTELPADLPAPLRNSISMQVLAAIRSLHLSSSPTFPNGILHRDIKPNNFLVELKNGWVHVVVVDFGSSRDRCDLSDESICVLGTPAYLAPESFKKRIHNEKTEFFSAGLIMSLGLIYDGYNRFENFQNKIKPKFESPYPDDIFKACPEVALIWSEWEALEKNDPWQYRIKKFAARLIQPNPEHRPESSEVDELIALMSVVENQFRQRGGYTKSGLKRSKKFMFSIEVPPMRPPEDSTRASPGSRRRSLARSKISGSSGSLSISTSPSISPKPRTPDSSSGKSPRKTVSPKIIPENQRASQTL